MKEHVDWLDRELYFVSQEATEKTKKTDIFLEVDRINGPTGPNFLFN